MSARNAVPLMKMQHTLPFRKRVQTGSPVWKEKHWNRFQTADLQKNMENMLFPGGAGPSYSEIWISSIKINHLLHCIVNRVIYFYCVLYISERKQVNLFFFRHTVEDSHFIHSIDNALAYLASLFKSSFDVKGCSLRASTISFATVFPKAGMQLNGGRSAPSSMRNSEADDLFKSIGRNFKPRRYISAAASITVALPFPPPLGEVAN